MSHMINLQNSQIESKNQLENFLKKHAVIKDHEYHTHTCYGPPYGKYNISDTDTKLFFNLYCNAMKQGIDLHVIERPKYVGPLLIDIDFKFDINHGKRSYKQKDIICIISNLNNIIKKYYKINTELLQSFVLEKKTPSAIMDKENIIKEYKDGFHIIYPFIAMTEEMRYVVLHNVKINIKNNNGLKHIPFTNSLDKVFDFDIIKKNGFIMYGSKKENGLMYYLTHIYTYVYDEIDIKKYNDNELVQILSNRKFDDNNKTPLNKNIPKDELQNNINEILKLYNISKKETINDNNNINKQLEIIQNKKDSSEKEINLAKKLVLIMSKNRATQYSDWILVGWALYNISPSLLSTFKEFSKLADNLYDEESCEKVWKNAIKRNLSIASLRYWAQLDNPICYNKIISESISDIIIKAESGTEYDVATVLYEMYKGKYKCTDLKSDIWYEFQNHRWINIPNGYTLSIKISEELTKEFAELNLYYMMQLGKRDNINISADQEELILKKSNNITKIMLNLRKNSFKERVMKECKIKFFDSSFEENLDSNRNLIGFNNGVYDLDNDNFRDGTPEDLISLSVGYDYKKYSIDHDYILGIEDYFSKVQVDKEMREYILTLLASYLDGHTKNQHFIIWTGSGCHAAGTFVKMYNNSIKKVENIKIGDVLMGDDYKPRTVKHLYRGQEKMYKINQIDGNNYIVNGAHRLSLKFMYDMTLKIDNLKKYTITWYEFSNKFGIIEKIKYFNSNEINKEFDIVNFNKNNINMIPNGHIINIPVNLYLKLHNDIKKLLYGYKSTLIKSKNLNDYILHTLTEISIENLNENNYYGFELTGNQKYLLMDNTVVMNSNGKSKTVELFQLSFGDYCGVIPVTLLTKKRCSSGQATPELAGMKGKRFIVFQEPENNDEIQIGFMKELTGGDWIYARSLFREPIRYKPQFKLLLTCNKLPYIPSSDGGTWRRIRVSPWETEFVDNPETINQFKKDYELLDKLELWKSAFIWYLLNKYYPIYKKNGLKEPAKVTQFTNNYKKQSDIFLEYFDSALDITKNNEDFESLDIIYLCLKQWYCDSYTGRCPYAKKDLVNYLTCNNFKIDKKYIYGVKLTNNDKLKKNELDE